MLSTSNFHGYEKKKKLHCKILKLKILTMYLAKKTIAGYFLTKHYWLFSTMAVGMITIIKDFTVS